jgi:tetratricopeptide (TPR) repeat protein
VNRSYRLLSSSQALYRRYLRTTLALFVVLMSMPGHSTVAQDSQSPQSAPATIEGTVFDADSKPIAAASVKLEQKDAPAIETTTNAAGAFVFSDLRAGSYILSAEKSSLRSAATAVSVSPSEQKHVNLIFEPSQAGVGASSPDAMAFSDKPDFTVAGIIDRTASAGHGSDTSLRASESLARATAALKPDSAAVSAPNSTPDSETKLRAALADAPGSFEANHQLGEFCFHKGSYREAIPLLEAACRIDPANRANEYDLALAYQQAGDFAQARSHVQKLLAHEDNAGLHRLLGDLDEETGDSLAAVHEYEQAVRLDPDEANYFAWGSELLLHRAVQPAVEVFEKGTELHPASARMLAAQGAALFARGQYDDAARRLCAASDLNPADSAPYIFLGKIDMVAPAPLACVEPKLQRFVQQQPEDARANYYYAMALMKRQKPTEDPADLKQIETLLSKAVALDPGYDEANLQLGMLYSVERNFEKAIGFYTKAIEINPQLSEAHYRLGVAYERIGEPARAKHEFQLHDETEKQQAAAVERQRREVKQFLVVLQQPAHPAAN